MDIIRGCLDILFRKQSPQSIIDSTLKNDKKKRKQLHNKIDKNVFIKLALEQFKHYSEDEAENIYSKICSSMEDMREIRSRTSEENKFSSVFNLLIQFTEDVLVEKNKEPFCKYEQMLRWRMISHKLDQDLFTTAYFAYRDVLSSRERNYFTWEPVIRSDNNRLHEMLKKGMAENHFHLKGSAPYFHLTWISLMNRMINRNKEFRDSGIRDKKLESDLEYDDHDVICNISKLVRKAAIIRAFIFSILNQVEFFSEDEGGIKGKKYQLKKLKGLLAKDTSSYSILDDDLNLELDEIQDEINILKYEYGYKFESTHYNEPVAVDYCIPKNLASSNNNSNVFLAGERRFMYLMFKKIYEKDKEVLPYADLFYAYLIIKARFRGELVQINDRVGFKNFSDYQDRKTKFLKKEPILSDAVIYMAIRSTMKDQNVKSLEVRICPEKTARETASEIKKLDRVIEAEDNSKKAMKSLKDQEEEFNRLIGIEKEEQNIDKEYFYVLHFPKNKDNTDYNKKNDIDNKIIISLRPRDYELRKTVQQQSLDIVSLREKISPVVKRILGIDACTNEIGCRPEVFAQAFRFLSNHTNGTESEHLFQEYEIPQLRSTYHAGEDFLDLADGLRAIDESICFLGLNHGDRIGHALALGVDVEGWYASKHYRLILPKQDYLDNIAWVIAKIKEFNIKDSQNLVYELEDQFNILFQDIYQKNFDNKDFENKEFPQYVYNHNTYYNAWKLRGDEPELYLEGKYKKDIEIYYWDRCKRNNLIDDSVRNNKSCAYLYSNYHYNFKIKKAGAEQYDFQVSISYVKAVKEIQKKMQRIIAHRGIGIEANPSSNYLIGSFKEYHKHPIINFYNLGLTTDLEKINNCEQLFVSINTDDQGVFGTYLENEYALLAISLEKTKDEKGELLYNQAMIYDWLDRIRQMGLEQSFKVK